LWTKCEMVRRLLRVTLSPCKWVGEDQSRERREGVRDRNIA
jgi:hypothetical protein